MFIPLPIIIGLGVIALLVCLAFLPAWLMGLDEWLYARREKRGPPRFSPVDWVNRHIIDRKGWQNKK